MIGSSTSIRRKLSLIVFCAVLLAIVIATAASAWREANRFAVAKRAELAGTANVFASAVADDLAANDRTLAYQKLRAIARIPGIKFAGVEDAQGRRFAEIGAGVVLQRARPDDNAGWFSSFDLLFQDTVEVGVDVFKSGRIIGRLVLMADASELRDRLMESLISAGLAALIAALFGIAVAWRWQRQITGPIQNLTQAMADVRESQDFSKQVERQSDDETGIMVDAFNDMLLHIRERDDRLAQHRAQLETKVEERTKDLRVAKEAAESANVAKSEFLATMSHEIRTPMNGMLVMAELISGAELAPRQQRYAEVIVKSGQSLLSIINDILDFSKIESGAMEVERIPVDPASVIDDVLNLFWERAASKGLDLGGYVDASVPALIEADPVRLNQILSNLVNNALKFTETGHVCVIAGLRPSTTQAPHDLTVEFCVKDTGIGIPDDKVSTIFSAFSQADQSTTRKYGGTGLGLAICKRLVHAMGGEIGATSKPGKGSDFSFTIASRNLDTTSQEPVGHEKTLRRALVAVDGTVTPLVIASYLQNHGVTVQRITPDAMTPEDCARADAVFVTPALVHKATASAYRFTICVSELGDSTSDEHLETGRAQDLVMRPVSRRAMLDLIDRLDRGQPLGRNATRRNSNVGIALPSFKGVRVLVADDSAVNREVIIEALSRLDIEPDVVTDGQAAVDAAAAQEYDMVLMDCSMPVLDGFAATRAIRGGETEGRRMPIVALTAHVAGGPVDMWKTAGMDDCMTKPFTLKALAGCFEQWLPDAAEHRQDVPPQSPDDQPVDALPEAPLSPGDDPVPVIDPSVMEMIGGIGGDDATGLIDRVFGLYEAHAPDALQTIEHELAGGDREAIAKAAHALKSMSFNVGARRVGEACDVLEEAARAQPDTALELYLPPIASALAEAFDRINDLKKAA